MQNVGHDTFCATQPLSETSHVNAFLSLSHSLDSSRSSLSHANSYTFFLQNFQKSTTPLTFMQSSTW